MKRKITKPVKKVSRPVRKSSVFYGIPKIYFYGISLFLLITTIVFVSNLQSIQNLRSRAQITNCTVASTDLSIDSEEQKAFDQINAYRQQNGKSPLKMSSSLSQAAAWLSRDLANKNYLEHTDSFGRDIGTRLGNCGYSGSAGGENIGLTTGGTADELLTTWKNSEVHKANLLSGSWVVAGIARTLGSQGYNWVLDFGNTDDASPSLAIISPEPSAPEEEVVPSAVCAGSGTGSVCPSPSVVLITETPQTPTTAISPAVDDQISAEPSTGTPEISEQPGAENNNAANKINNGSKNFIQLLMAFFMIIIQFILSLFKG